MPDKIKCLVVDDEAAAHYVLINYISSVERLELAGQCYSVVEAINFLHANTAGLVFMDINMPELTGFDFLKALASPPAVIFTTAYQQYALESYEYGVVDYLLKPIEFARFLKAVDRFLLLQASRPGAEPNDIILPEPTVTVKVDGEMATINLDEIIYTQSLGNYVKLITTKRTYICSMTTSELEKRLPPDTFVRIHKSHVISLPKVEKWLNNSLLIGGKELPVGITYKRILAVRFK
jgi:DNA-binding LytR/AlgR family response regulator